MIHGFITIRIIGPDDGSHTDFTFDIREIPENQELWQAIYDAGFECRDAIYQAARVPTRKKVGESAQPQPTDRVYVKEEGWP